MKSLKLNPLNIGIYRLLVVPSFLFLILFLALVGHKKIRAGLKMRWPRRGHHPWFDLPKKTRPIWFHCSSGEFEYAKPVIKTLKKKHPNWPILVTYFSPTYKTNIENFEYVDMSAPLPWDTPSSIISFLKHHEPRALLIARTDLWPELLHQAHKRKVPSLLFSATLSKKKPAAFNFFWSWIYNLIDSIFSVSQEDKVNFLDSGALVVNAYGDTRYDQVFDRLENPKKLKTFLDHDLNVQTLICGSTWEEDEVVILKALDDLVFNSHIQLVLVPHEPHKVHLEKLESLIAKHGLSSTRYSQAHQWSPSQILIIDQTGILAEIYKYGSLALVGGSFKSSVHSVMEPLATGAITFLGPYHQNNREALQYKNQSAFNQTPNYKVSSSTDGGLNIVNCVKDHIELRQKVIEALKVPPEIQQNIRQNIINKINSNRGASEQVLKWIENRLSPEWLTAPSTAEEGDFLRFDNPE